MRSASASAKVEQDVADNAYISSKPATKGKDIQRISSIFSFREPQEAF
jgi:hypothetical protein